VAADLRVQTAGLSALLVLPLIVVGGRGPLLFRSAGSLEANLGTGLRGPVFDAEGRLLEVDAPPARTPWHRVGRRCARGLVELRVVDADPVHQYRLRLELERALGLEPHSGQALFDLVVSAIGRFGLI
jgi:hypothetical protein